MNLIQEIQNTTELWTEKTIERNGYIIQPGEVEKHIYFVKEGSLRIFFISEFEEHTIRFGYKNSLITSLSSFLTNSPSEYYMQAIKKSTLQVIRKDDFKTFVHENEDRQLQYQAILENVVVQQLEREIDLLTYSPVERVKRVQQRSPQLFQEIPSKYIASYLRMTPETLSRIRKS
jgi:CRP-like cAMP-binding protein